MFERLKDSPIFKLSPKLIEARKVHYKKIRRDNLSKRMKSKKKRIKWYQDNDLIIKHLRKNFENN